MPLRKNITCWTTKEREQHRLRRRERETREKPEGKRRRRDEIDEDRLVGGGAARIYTLLPFSGIIPLVHYYFSARVAVLYSVSSRNPLSRFNETATNVSRAVLIIFFYFFYFYFFF
ncbi:hypothetical protein PUN28_003855 [Cardiocondyla obscurior]|uniref:Uncharacterized protein n=1 Tax=Cardiocondyla obscurior TaxID=286306 RepID=A0AAW2GKK4_9HYME